MRLKRYLKEELLLEKTFDIAKDVDFLYNKSYKPIFDMFKKVNLSKHAAKATIDPKLMDQMKFIQVELARVLKNAIMFSTDSSKLKGKDAKMAHEVNPVRIDIGVFDRGSFYIPQEKFIQMSLNKQVIELVRDSGSTFDISFIPTEQLRRFANEFKPERAKTTMAHELSHWISDSLHNFYLTKTTKTAWELQKPEILLLHKKDVNMTHFEIDAQVHAIKQLKASNKKQWDSLTLVDLFTMYQSLIGVASGVVRYGEDVLNIWQKALVKRMAREKILGKNMRKFVTPQELKKI